MRPTYLAYLIIFDSIILIIFNQIYKLNFIAFIHSRKWRFLNICTGYINNTRSPEPHLQYQCTARQTEAGTNVGEALSYSS
jgi:hypothetical protein